MTSDDVDEINDRLYAIVASWTDDWLTRLIDELRAAFARFGQPLKDELTMPDFVTADESQAIRRWIAIHVDDGDPDPGDDRWFRELATTGTDIVTLLYLFGKRAHPFVTLPPWSSHNLYPARAMRTLWWAVNGWRLPSVLARLQNVGLVGVLPPTETMVREADLDRGGHTSEGDMIVNALRRYGRCLAVDYEYSGQPVPHDRLVMAFGHASGGPFAPANATQSPRDNASYAISFDHAGQRHTFTVPYEGDCYHVAGVANASNAALAAAGEVVRFHQLVNADTAVYLCGAPTLLAQLDDELFLFLDNGAGHYERARADARIEQLRKALA